MTTQPSTQSQDTSVTNYSRVFKRLCHMAALTKEGKERKAIDNLVLTTLAIDDELPLGTVADIREAITTYFGISLSENTIQSSIDRHMSGSRIVRDPKAKIYTVSAQNKIQIENKINESISIEETIQTDWFPVKYHKQYDSPDLICNRGECVCLSWNTKLLFYRCRSQICQCNGIPFPQWALLQTYESCP